MKEKKLIIDVRMIHASGIGIYIQSIIPLIKKNFDLILIGKEQEISQYSWSKDIKIIKANSPFYSIDEQLELPYKIPNGSLFWSPHYNVPILPIKIKKRLVTIHDVFHLAFFDTLNIKQKMYAKFIMKAATNLSGHIITVSKFSKSEIIKYTKTSPSKITVIYNGIDHIKFTKIRNGELLKEIKGKYGLPDRFILFVGNVKPHKNLKTLIKAISILQNKKALYDYFLVIVGKKEGFITGDKDIEHLIGSLSLEPYIKFTGFVKDEDLSVIYNLASALIFPSLYEGFGFPPLEAMACGCPVVLSNAASLPEVCGSAALYCNPFDYQDISSKIKTIIENASIREELIKKGYLQAKKYSWEKCAEETTAVINNLLNN